MEKVDLEALDVMMRNIDGRTILRGHFRAALHNTYPALAAELRALREERDTLRKSIQDTISLAHELGWNGVENSKIMAVFLRDHIDTLRAEAARLREALVWQLDAMDTGYFHTNGYYSCQECSESALERECLQHTEECPLGNIEFALNSTPATAEWLAARDEEMKRLGAAEELEKIGEWCRCGDVNPDDARDEIARACKNRAAQLRREAEKQ